MDKDITLQQVFQWSEKHVVEWLREQGLDRYESEFTKHQIDGVALLELNYNLLKELNVRTVGERVKLNAAISQLRNKCLFNSQKSANHVPKSAPLVGQSAAQHQQPKQHIDVLPPFEQKNASNPIGRKRSNIWAHKLEEKASGPSSIQRSSSGPVQSTTSSNSKGVGLSHPQFDKDTFEPISSLSNIQAKRQSSRFSKRVGYLPQVTDSWSGLESQFKDLFDTDDGISKLADSLSVDRRQVAVIGANGETKHVDVTSAKTARDVLDLILCEFGLMADVDKDKYALFVMSGEGGGARSLSDEELIAICSNSPNNTKERLFLRKRHLINRAIDGVQRSLRVQRTIEKLGTILPASASNALTPPPNSAPLQMKGNGNINKLAHFFGERPPAEQVSENLNKYFPGNEVRVRHSIMRGWKQFDPSEIPFPLPNVPDSHKLRPSTSLNSFRDSDSDGSDCVVTTEYESGDDIIDNVMSDGDIIIEESEEELEEQLDNEASNNSNASDELHNVTVTSSDEKIPKETTPHTSEPPKVSTEAQNKATLEQHPPPTTSSRSFSASQNTQTATQPQPQPPKGKSPLIVESATTMDDGPQKSTVNKRSSIANSTHPPSLTINPLSETAVVANKPLMISTEEPGQSTQSKETLSPLIPISGCVAELSTLVEAPENSEENIEEATTKAPTTSVAAKRSSRRSVFSKRHSNMKRISGASSLNFGGIMMPGMRKSGMRYRKGSWIKGAPIASGSFGSVYYGVHTKKGVIMAVKEVDLPIPGSVTEARKKRMLSALQRELTLLQDIRHKNIVQYLGTEMDNEHLYIFLEYVAGGSVASLLSSFGAFPETLVRSYVRQTLEGLEYLHSKNIIHCDIKGGNVLVDPLGHVKISDFGISKKVDEVVLQTSNHRLSLQGSVFWMAPEVVKDTKYTIKGDVWSLGCLIIEMLTANHPFAKYDQLQALLMIGKRQQPEMPSHVSKDCLELLEKALSLDYEERPTADELLKFKFVSEANVPTTA
ncbi:ATP binding [Mycoemilia scoparia]|uniref:ATP binding n=1 Tax=Mycoemilia scoparia TaxID=417184 RepID=A0A9W8A7J8_9FUNG|nr:ATP binding [Mycoemilia scoparia]